MSAQRKSVEISLQEQLLTGPALHDGAEVGLFTSSMSPVGGAEALLGDATEMFTSSMGPLARTDAELGDGVEMFTSSMGPVSASDAASGEAVGAFTSSMNTVEKTEAEIAEQLEKIIEIAKRHNPVELRESQSAEESALIWKGRKSAFGAMGQISDYYCMDGVIPIARLAEFSAVKNCSRGTLIDHERRE